ncbi:biotin transporter BioY [Sporolituus thermophilus]|uniref:Biotin transporter n=1 Tax=Sporolituus thermophilus DSM 23256 TaxID=1123285 RepID=A0A1G7IXE6_9FIRM|nr:biotin transporter BioY [Sporolituus thermophilus]SDF17351.1 biotin transport system substrate-specific component [Sporolituus thermophilus DSM 23256]
MPIRNMVLTGLFAALLAVGSQVSIPLGPVPHTLQVFFVMLAGVILGSRWAPASVAVWILLGCFGLPVFAQGKAGVAVLAGPTGGFLVGFMVCAYLVGLLTERTQLSVWRAAGAMLAGLVTAYALGLMGFMASFKYFLHKPMTWDKAISLAVLPFIPFDVIKSVMAAYIGVKVRRALLRAGYID